MGDDNKTNDDAAIDSFKKDFSETHGFMAMCGIMYFASIVYVYNRHLKIFGYFILVFIFAVSWLFIAKNRNEYFDGFITTNLYKILFKAGGKIDEKSYGPYILYFVYFLAALSVIINSYGIGTVLKSYMDRIAQVKSYNLNLSQMRRDDLFIFNTAFYVSTFLLIGLIYSFSFFEDDKDGKNNEEDKDGKNEPITINDLSYINYAQMVAFVIAIIASILVAIYSTKFKSVKNDSLPKTNTNTENIKGQTKFSDYSFGALRNPVNSSSISGTDLLKNVNQLTPIRLEEIDQTTDITIQSYQNLIIAEGKTLTIAEGKTLTNNGYMTNNGTIRNNGTIVNNETITNNNTIDNLGIINTSKTISGTINNSGIINDSSVTEIPLINIATLSSNIYTLNGNFTIPSGKKLIIPSDNTLYIPSGKTLTNYGTIENNKTIENNGTIQNDGAVVNNKTITNNGTIKNDGAVVNNKTIVNNGTITNNGTIYSLTSLTALKISENGIVFDSNIGISDKTITLNNNFTILAGKTLMIPVGIVLIISSKKTLTNDGTIKNNGTITNDGTIKNNGTIENNGTYSGNRPNPKGTIK